MRIEVMGVPFDNVTMDEALDRALELISEPGCALCVTPNAEIVYEAMEDPALREDLSSAELVLPDGAGVVLAAKILGTPVKEKVAGIEFGTRLMERLAGTEKTFYFLGGKPGVAEQAAEKMKTRFPSLRICGARDGYFSEDDPVIDGINRVRPDVLFVCLGAPKQERFMVRNRQALQASFAVGLGGSLDGFAGNVKRAPRWMIRCNLEWLYRLIKEPWRIGRMMRLPKFMLRVLARRMRG